MSVITKTAFQKSGFQLSGFQIATAAGGGDLPPWLLRLMRTRARARTREQEPLTDDIVALLASLRAKQTPQPARVNLGPLAAAADRSRREAERLAVLAAELKARQAETRRLEDIDNAVVAAIAAERARVDAERIAAELAAALEAQAVEAERIAALVAARREAARLSEIELAATVAAALTKQRADQARFSAFADLVDQTLDDGWLEAA